MSQYQPLADYGLIGDCHTAALVSNRGSIDWLCVPRFDSPSIFARILDSAKGGYFSVSASEPFDSVCEYVSNTGVLATRFKTSKGVLELTDFMSIEPGDEPLRWGKPRASRRLVRLLRAIDADVEVVVTFSPRPDYALETRQLAAFPGGVLVIRADGAQHCLYSTVPLEIATEGACARTTVRMGEQHAFVLELEPTAANPLSGDLLAAATADLRETIAFWQAWCVRCRYRGPYEHAVMRSALTLKMLSYAPTGAMVAAPTTSLPEELGGVRNWDYRYTWIRDASFAAYALLTGGHLEDGISFFEWICGVALQHKAGDLQIMYGLSGERQLDEYTLDHLEGYEGSRPVRVGNGASAQVQLDVYGELLDCFHTYRCLRRIPAEDLAHLWPAFRHQVDYIANNWRKPDSGIWEVRSAPRHFVYSKVMAWTTLDRGIKAAEDLGLEADTARWKVERGKVRAEILEKGYDATLGSFTQSYGERAVDAANLLLPIVGFIDGQDDRIKSTVERISQTLVHDGLVYRYCGADDGLSGDEATFGACTFWLADALIAVGRVEEAKALFERMVKRATPLGLYAEELEPKANLHLGNFPQALTHLALMNTAVRLAHADAFDPAAAKAVAKPLVDPTLSGQIAVAVQPNGIARTAVRDGMLHLLTLHRADPEAIKKTLSFVAAGVLDGAAAHTEKADALLEDGLAGADDALAYFIDALQAGVTELCSAPAAEAQAEAAQAAVTARDLESALLGAFENMGLHGDAVLWPALFAATDSARAHGTATSRAAAQLVHDVARQLGDISAAAQAAGKVHRGALSLRALEAAFRAMELRASSAEVLSNGDHALG